MFQHSDQRARKQKPKKKRATTTKNKTPDPEICRRSKVWPLCQCLRACRFCFTESSTACAKTLGAASLVYPLPIIPFGNRRRLPRQAHEDKKIKESQWADQKGDQNLFEVARFAGPVHF